MPVKNIKHIPVFTWIPPQFGPVYKIEVEKSNGTLYDITDIIYDSSYTDGMTDTIGNFSVTIDNSNESYTDTFSVYDKVNFYMDYGTDAVTKKFVGLIEKPTKKNNKITLTGRGLAVRTLGITVTKSYSDTECSVILTDLFSTYASYITTNNVNISSTNITVNWNQKPFWDCIVELCGKAGFDSYIDSNSDCHFFQSDTLTNITDAIVHEYNLIETGEFAPDLSVVKNKVIVYGSSNNGLQIVWTAENTNSIKSREQGGYDVKELIINDSNITTIQQAQDRANYELSLSQNPPIVGDLTSLLLPTLNPGEMVRVSDPMNGLNPTFYRVQKFTHKFSNDEPPQTSITIYKEINTVATVLKKRVKFESETTEKANPNEMKYSWIYNFDANTGIHNSTTIADGYLIPVGASGTWISNVYNSDTIASMTELRVDGSSLSGIQFYISCDGGVNYQSIMPYTAITTIPPGSILRFKCTFNNANQQISSFIVLFK